MTMVAHEERAEPAFRPLRCAVVTLSDSRGEADDRSGALIIERLLTAGHELTLRRLIRDDAEALRALVTFMRKVFDERVQGFDFLGHSANCSFSTAC